MRYDDPRLRGTNMPTASYAEISVDSSTRKDTGKMWFYGNHNSNQYELNKKFRNDLSNPIFLCNALGIVMPAFPSEPNDDYDDESIVTSDDLLQFHTDPSEQVGIPECDQKEIARFMEEDRDDVGVADVSFEDNIDIPGECECGLDTQDSLSDPMTLCDAMDIVMSPSLPSIAEKDDDSIIASDDHHDLQMHSFSQKLGRPEGAHNKYDRHGAIPLYDERGNGRDLPRNALPSSKCDRNENRHGRMNAKLTARGTRRRTLSPARKPKSIRHVKDKGALASKKVGGRTIGCYDESGNRRILPENTMPSSKCDRNKNHHGRINAKLTTRDTHRRSLSPAHEQKRIRKEKEKGALGRGKVGERTIASAEHFDSLQLNPGENGINDKYPLEKSHGEEHPRRIWRNPRKLLRLLTRRRKGRC